MTSLIEFLCMNLVCEGVPQWGGLAHLCLVGSWWPKAGCGKQRTTSLSLLWYQKGSEFAFDSFPMLTNHTGRQQGPAVSVWHPWHSSWQVAFRPLHLLNLPSFSSWEGVRVQCLAYRADGRHILAADTHHRVRWVQSLILSLFFISAFTPGHITLKSCRTPQWSKKITPSCLSSPTTRTATLCSTLRHRASTCGTSRLGREDTSP